MVKVVVPDGINAVTTVCWQTQHADFLRLIFGHDEQRAVPASLPRGGYQFGQNVAVRLVDDRLRGIKAQPIEMEFVDPVTGIGPKELPNRTGVLSIRVNGPAPFTLMSVRRVIVGELWKLVF